jgi:hypothetical protein
MPVTRSSSDFPAPMPGPADIGTGRAQPPQRQQPVSYGRLARAYIEQPETLQKLVRAYLGDKLKASRLGGDACIHRLNGLLMYWCADEALFSDDGRRETLRRTMEREISAAVEKRREEVTAQRFGRLGPGCGLRDWQRQQVDEQCDRFRAERLAGLEVELEKRLEQPAAWTYKGRGRWVDEGSRAEVQAETSYLRLELHLGGIEQVAPAVGTPVLAIVDVDVDDATVAACRRKGVTVVMLGDAFEAFLDAHEERQEAARPKPAALPTI